MGALASELDWLASASSSDVPGFYAAIGVGLPERSGGGEAAIRCFANAAGHTNDDRKPSCSVNLLTGLWHCKGCGASGNAYHAALSVGRTEEQSRDIAKRYGLFIESVKAPRQKPKMPGERDMKKWRGTLRGSESLLGRLYEVKGWTPKAIYRCGLGWDGERVVFPIRNHRLKIVGAVRYLPGGKPKSLAVAGSKRLLFPAPEAVGRQRPLFVVEGEPDAVSVWSCGHQAVAIPGAGSWRPEFLTRLVRHRVVVLADCDPQGRALARRVASELPGGKWVDVEPGRDDGYDIGDMVREAAIGGGGLRQMHKLLEDLASE
jgi:hypothetical protein